MSESKFDDPQPFDSPQAIRAMNERQAKAAMLMQELALAGLAELRQKMQQGLPLNLSADDIRELLLGGVRLELAASCGPKGHLPKKVN
jgi:hypothetical protein